MLLFQQNSNSANINKSQERGIELIVASKDSTKPLEFLEETLHQMTLLVNVPIDGPWVGGRVLWRDRISGVLGRDILPNGLGPIGFIPQDIATFNIDLTEQFNRVNRIMILAWREQESKRIAQTIH